MAKDYAKIKAMAQSILECIGEEDEGENPVLPKTDSAVNNGGAEPNTKFLGSAESGDDDSNDGDEDDKKKKKKDASLAMMSSMLSNKFGKSAAS